MTPHSWNIREMRPIAGPALTGPDEVSAERGVHDQLCQPGVTPRGARHTWAWTGPDPRGPRVGADT